MSMQNNIGLWTSIPMYCPNCGELNDGYQKDDGKVRYECRRCALQMIRSYKNRRHDLIELTIPKGMGRLRPI